MGLPVRASSLLLLATSGCSWAYMARPPSPPVEPAPAVACTTSRAAPVLDTVGAVLLTVPGAATLAWGLQPACTSCLLSPGSGGEKAAGIGIGLALLGLAAVQTVSAVQGYGWASDCESIREHQLACVSGVEASCVILRSPPPRPGRSAGERCDADEECRGGTICHLGHCQAGAR